MAASNTDKVRKASSGSGDPVVTSLALAKTAGSTTAELTSATNWDTSTGVDVIMYRRQLNSTTGLYEKQDGTQTSWVGVLTGTTLSGLVLRSGTEPASGYAADGNTVVLCGPTSAWGDDFATAFLTQHNQDGSHGVVTATSVDATTLSQRGVNLETIRKETTSDFVASGGVIAQTTALTGSFSDIVYYIAGRRYTKTGVANHTYTASKDTYVDIDTSGNITYVEVANGATTGMTLTANSVRVAEVVTSGSAITSVTQSGADPLGRSLKPSGPIGASNIDSATFPSFKVYRNASYTTVSSTATKLPYDTKSWDIGIGFSTTNGNFTVTKPGRYVFTASMGLAAATSRVIMMVYANGGEVCRLSDIAVGGAYLLGGYGTGEVPLSLNDVVEVRYFLPNALSIVTGLAFTAFSGRYIGA